MGILVPAYFGSSSDRWGELNFAASRVPLVAIMIPGNGPGTTQNPNCVAAVNSLRAAGGRVIGYVYTFYTARDTNVVRADISRYFSFYAVDGVFLDEMTNDANTSQCCFREVWIGTARFRRVEQILLQHDDRIDIVPVILWVKRQTHTVVRLQQRYFAAAVEQPGCGKMTAVSGPG